MLCRLAIVCLLLLPRNALANSCELILLDCRGQSQMVGQGAQNQQPLNYPDSSIHSHLFLFANGVLGSDGARRWGWVQSPVEPIDSSANQLLQVSADGNALVGPCLAFAETIALAIPTASVAIVPNAKSATGSPLWAYTSPGPPKVRNNSTSKLWGAALWRMQAVWLGAHNSPLGPMSTERAKAISFSAQGEHDAQIQSEADGYATVWQESIDATREEMNIPIVFVVVKLPPTIPSPTSSYPYWNQVRAAQQSLESITGDGDDQIIVQSPDGPYKSDGIHLTTAGTIQLGRDAANAWLDLGYCD